jgi:hypothetical protein
MIAPITIVRTAPTYDLNLGLPLTVHCICNPNKSRFLKFFKPPKLDPYFFYLFYIFK